MVSMLKTRIGRTAALVLSLGVMLSVFSAPAIAAVQADLDRNRVTVGETVTLTFRTDSAQQKLAPDLSVLEKDFRILDQRSETQLSIVGGRQTALVRLLVTLEPLHEGQVRIPSFAIDQDRTQPLSLTVLPAPELAPGELPPVFLEVEIIPGDGPHYVHAQLGLLVRIFYLPETTDAAISPPEPTPAAVRLLQETPYQAERGGERYRVLERHYAIFPERSGELVIPAMRLTGRLVERNNSAVWQPRVRGRRINAESEEIRLDIQPRPDGFEGADWLPARELAVSQQISAVDALKVGEPVTRTVIVEAVGLEENMLVEPAWPEIEGARIYPDQPQGITRDDGQWVLGHKEFRYAVVPENEGELVLPELTLYWWDTVNNEQRRAVLPERRIAVQASALVPEPTPIDSGMATPMVEPVSTVTAAEPTFWRWLTLLFAAAWVVTLWFAIRRPRHAGEAASDLHEDRLRGPSALMDEIRKACRAGDAPRSRRALSRWIQAGGAGSAFSNGSMLEFAVGCEDEALRQAIYELDAAGFRAEKSSNWNGQALLKQLESWLQARRDEPQRSTANLADLYASGR
jgi:hypothetical protein